MKYLSFLFCLSIIACSSPSEPEKKFKSFEERHEPFDHEDIKLFGPAPTDRDIDFYTESSREAVSQAVSRDGEFTEPWTIQGPNNLGGRVNALAVDPNDDNIIFAGFARGGLWKTTDGGNNWSSLWDDQLTQAVSAITIDPTNSDIVYAGSGDINISGNSYLGNGLFRSDDGGTTWVNIGLEETKIIGRIIVNPTNTDEILVATMGNVFIEDDNRGIYKSVDGGATWVQVLHVTDDTGVHDLAFHPDNPETILAAAWTRYRTGKESRIASENCRVYHSTDFGSTWEITEMDLPEVTGRPAITFKNNDPQVAYAMMMNDNSRYISLHKSLDAGASWTMIDSTNETTPTMMGGFGWFFATVGALVRPEDQADKFFLCGVDLWSFDEETKMWDRETPPWWYYEVHADKHVIIQDNSGALLLGTDGGIYKKDMGTETWYDIENIPNNMFYRVEVSPHITDEYYGGMQDNGSTGGNTSNADEWPRIWGGDGFQMRFRPDNPDAYFVETQNGNITFVDGFNSIFLNLEEMETDRKNWDMQYILSPHDPTVVYTGTFRAVKFDVFDSYEISVEPISEQLTDDLEFISGYHTITALDESPLVEGLLYYGTADGNIWNRQDGEWNLINNGIDKHYVTSIKASPVDEATVFVTLSNYKFNDNSPRIYKSTDYGNTWESIHGNLPSGAVNDIIIYDEFDDKLLFAATNIGVYGSINGGESWDRVGSSMPFIPVNDMTFNKPEKTLVAGTFGRSINTYDLSKIIELLSNPESTEDFLSDNIKIYPNPFTDFIRIESEESIDRIAIYSASGAVVYTSKFTSSVDLSSLPGGVYFVELASAKSKILGRKKVVKK